MREAAVEAAKKVEDEPIQMEALEEEVKAPERHVGGEIPPVKDDVAQAKTGATASELAFDNPDVVGHDVRAMVALHIVNEFNRDTKAAFEHYDSGKDGQLSQSELAAILTASGVDKASELAAKIIGEDELAMDFDAALDWDGFERSFAD